MPVVQAFNLLFFLCHSERKKKLDIILQLKVLTSIRHLPIGDYFKQKYPKWPDIWFDAESVVADCLRGCPFHWEFCFSPSFIYVFIFYLSWVKRSKPDFRSASAKHLSIWLRSARALSYHLLSKLVSFMALKYPLSEVYHWIQLHSWEMQKLHQRLF